MKTIKIDCIKCEGTGISCGECKGRGFKTTTVDNEVWDKVIVCPYCMKENQLDPPLLCCSEAHAEVAYENADGDIFLWYELRGDQQNEIETMTKDERKNHDTRMPI